MGEGCRRGPAGNPGAMYCVVHTAAQRGDLAQVRYLVQELQHGRSSGAGGLSRGREAAAGDQAG